MIDEVVESQSQTQAAEQEDTSKTSTPAPASAASFGPAGSFLGLPDLSLGPNLRSDTTLRDFVLASGTTTTSITNTCTTGVTGVATTVGAGDKKEKPSRWVAEVMTVKA